MIAILPFNELDSKVFISLKIKKQNLEERRLIILIKFIRVV
jgi:hypothetical protein